MLDKKLKRQIDAAILAILAGGTSAGTALLLAMLSDELAYYVGFICGFFSAILWLCVFAWFFTVVAKDEDN